MRFSDLSVLLKRMCTVLLPGAVVKVFSTDSLPCAMTSSLGVAGMTAATACKCNDTSLVAGIMKLQLEAQCAVILRILAWALTPPTTTRSDSASSMLKVISPLALRKTHCLGEDVLVLLGQGEDAR